MAERVETDLGAYMIEFKGLPLSYLAADIRYDIRICGALGGFPQPLPDAQFRSPRGIRERLNTLMDKQNAGALTDSEQREAEGLANLAVLLSLLQLRAERVSGYAD